jgi:hypothetical protein
MEGFVFTKENKTTGVTLNKTEKVHCIHGTAKRTNGTEEEGDNVE